MFKRKTARAKSPTGNKRNSITSPRFYEILDYVATKMDVPIQFSTLVKKRFNVNKDQISEPREFQHIFHTESAEEAREMLESLSKAPTMNKLPDPSIRSKTISKVDSIYGPISSRKSATGTVVIKDVIIDNRTESVSAPNIVPSLATVEKSAATKIFFENYFYKILKEPSERAKRRLQLESELEEMSITEEDKREIRQEWINLESDYMRLLRTKINVNSFYMVKTIGHGAFGVVKLVREKSTGTLYAMKVMRKGDMLKKGQEGHIRAERDLLKEAAETAQWIVKLIYSFQDADHLYLVMEYMPGGDLLNLLIEKDIFEEEFAKFYVAEMVLCIEEAHRFGYIHRDIKPDNFLFDIDGHIRLSDFGLATDFHWAHDSAYYEQQRKDLLRKTGIDIETDTLTRLMGKKRQGNKWLEQWSDDEEDDLPGAQILTWRDKNRKTIAFSVVGTNNYMAPEVLRGNGYDRGCDWWSLGVIIFEMLYGYPPFCSKSRHTTRLKIINWRQTLRFPPRPRVSREAQDLIERLICERENRLGTGFSSTPNKDRPSSLYLPDHKSTAASLGNASDIKAHPWFKGVDWNNLHNLIPPFRPKLKNDVDTSHFEEIQDDNPLAPPEGEVERKPKDPMLRDRKHGNEILNMRKQLAFVGYTYRGLPLEKQRGGMAERMRGRTEEPDEGGLRLRSMSL